jgi:phage FluMu protein Com
MPTCPKCKQDIDELIIEREWRTLDTMNTDGDVESIDTSPWLYGERILQRFKCEKCMEILFVNWDDAEKFITQ